MHTIRLFTLLLCLLVLQSNAFSQQPGRGSVSDVAFIQGHWKSTNTDRVIDGVWLAPQNENMLGFMRMMKDGKASLYEMLAYEQTPNGLISLVKHFQPGLISVEEKDKQDRYRFVEASKDRAIFEKEGDANLRILYEKRSPDQFVIARGSLAEGKWVFRDLFVFNREK
jgi:hypothetical protein